MNFRENLFNALPVVCFLTQFFGKIPQTVVFDGFHITLREINAAGSNILIFPFLIQFSVDYHTSISCHTLSAVYFNPA